MNIVIVSASTRNGRLTHHASLGLQKALEQFDDIETIVLDLKQLDIHYFEEVMSKMTQPNKDVTNTFETLNKADAFLFVTPEYNGSYSGALKNMVDLYPKSTFARKAVGIVTVTTGAMGGMRAAMQLQQLILAIWAIPSPQMLLVPTVQNKFDNTGALLDDSFTKNIQAFLGEFLWLAKALKASK
jgi:NAD(P)H-dependent FMN reductase